MKLFSLLQVAVACVATAFAAAPAGAQEYPNRPIRMIVPFPAGGGVDAVGRVVAEKVGGILGQSVVIDNRGGAGGSVGTSVVAHAPADGYTLLLANSGHAILPFLSKPDWDPIKDFAPISQVVKLDMMILVRADSPIKTLGDLIATAKREPGKLSYGSSGIGGTFHLGMEMFKSMAGVDILHVPYKGNAPMATALLGGEVQMTMDTLAVSLPQVRLGKFRGLAVTSLTRLPLVPDVPTISESGVPGYEYEGWDGVLAPAGTPPAIVAKLNAAFVQAVESPDVKEKLAKIGFDAKSSTPQGLTDLITSDLKKYGKVIKDANIQGE